MGVLTRLILLFVTGGFLLDFVDFAVTKDFYDGKFSSDADSIGIPIIGTQILILGGLVLSSPLTLLGSGYFRAWVYKRSKVLSTLLLLFFLFCYFVLFVVSISGIGSIANEAYRERWFEGIALLALASFLFIFDVARIFTFKKPSSNERLVKLFNRIPI